jgi:hypothetical protein
VPGNGDEDLGNGDGEKEIWETVRIVAGEFTEVFEIEADEAEPSKSISESIGWI